MMKKLLLIVLSALMFFMGFNSYAKNIDESKINKISGLVNSDLEDKVLEIQGAKKDDVKALFIPARKVFTKLNFDICSTCFKASLLVLVPTLIFKVFKLLYVR